MKFNIIRLSVLTITLLISAKIYAQDLPLVISRAHIDTTPLIVFISDDSGWKDFEENVKTEFAFSNYAFIGLNANKYFEKRKTPQQVSKELAPTLRSYIADWNKEKVILIGNSFGAEVTPFIYNQLPIDIKNKIIKIVLLAPAASTDFEVHGNDIFGYTHNLNNSYNVPHEISKIKNIPIVCFWGKEEHPFYTIDQKPDNVVIQTLKGSHHFSDYKTVVNLSK